MTDRLFTLNSRQLDDFTLDSEVRRIISEQLRFAKIALDQTDQDKQGIHEARKCLKRLRACYQLLKHAPDSRGQAINRHFKEAARQVAELRDADILVETLGTLGDADSDTANSENHSQLRRHLEHQRSQLRGSFAEKTTVARQLLDQARSDISHLPAPLINKETLIAGLSETYKLGRKRWKKARRSGEDRDFHQWRKVVKYHLHHMQLLARFGDEFTRRINLLETLSDELGKHQDLYILNQHAQSSASNAKKLLTKITDKQRRLRQKADKLAEQLFSDSAENFRQHLETLLAA